MPDGCAQKSAKKDSYPKTLDSRHRYGEYTRMRDSQKDELSNGFGMDLIHRPPFMSPSKTNA
jgi:hypothetical protein